MCECVCIGISFTMQAQFVSRKSICFIPNHLSFVSQVVCCASRRHAFLHHKKTTCFVSYEDTALGQAWPGHEVMLHPLHPPPLPLPPWVTWVTRHSTDCFQVCL